MKNVLLVVGFLALGFASPVIGASEMTPAPTVEEFFNQLSQNTMDLVDRFYAENTHFLDPVVNLRGRKAVRKYYENLYQNVESIRFEFSGKIEQGDEQVAFWTMVLRAKGLNGGKEVRVIGNSHFRLDPQTRQALYHRDYFDMGEFIYEGVPVLGSVIRYIKGRLSAQ